MENFGINNNEFFENASFMENNKVEVLSKKLKKGRNLFKRVIQCFCKLKKGK